MDRRDNATASAVAVLLGVLMGNNPVAKGTTPDGAMDLVQSAIP